MTEMPRGCYVPCMSTANSRDRLPTWWDSADESTRREVREADYYSGTSPSPAVTESLARVGINVVGAHFPTAPPGPDAYVLPEVDSNTLRALDGASDDDEN